MGIKKLKQQNNEMSMSLIDLLGKFDISKTKKYTQFLVKMLHKQYNEEMMYRVTEERISHYTENRGQTFEDFVIKRVIFDHIFGWDEMSNFVKFCELMERGLIDEKDISKYDSWDMLEMQLYEAKNRELFKRSKKEIHKIFEDDNYMIFKPLTYASSCSYGYQTKWCTTMINEPAYFYNHSRGILIYLIDKKENKKFAFYKHFPNQYEISDDHQDYAFKTFNQEDKQIDTIQTGLPMNILQIILMECDLKSPTTIPNYRLFSEEEKNEMRKYTGSLPEDENLGGEKMLKVAEEIRPIVPITRRLRRRIDPMPVREPHGEDETECIMEENCTEDYLEELKLRVDIVREELEEQIHEHIHRSYDRQG